MDPLSNMLFKRFETTEIFMEDIIPKIIKNEYSSSKGEGFSINEIGENVLYGKYIYQYPSFINKFDENKLEIEKEKIIYKSIVNFSIDISYKLITVFSNKSGAHRLLTELGKIFDFEISIDDVNFSLPNLLLKFKEYNKNFNVNSIRIKNYKFNSQLTGTIWVKILEQQILEDLLSSYSGEIIYVGVSVTIDNRDISLGFFENGSLRIYNKVDDLYDIIDEIKIILFKE